MSTSSATSSSQPGRINRTFKYLFSTALSAFHALNDAQGSHIPGSPFSVVRHTRSWVYYQGVNTIVPITLLGSKSSSVDNLTVTLQRRGWRTGLFGWSFGAWLGGTLGKEVDVTPEKRGSWDAEVNKKARKKCDEEVSFFLSSYGLEKKHDVIGTLFIHIPVSSGDGYFRLLIYRSASSSKVIASTASFRVGSLSLRSAHPRGSTFLTLIPEVLLRTVSLTLTTAAWTAFFAAFPFLRLAQMFPQTHRWGTWALRRLGGEGFVVGLKEKYKVEERRQQAEHTVYRKVPFGSMGMRTAYDLAEDERLGKGGISFPR